VIYKRKNFQNIDPSGTAKLLDSQPIDNFPKDFAVKIKITTPELEILHSLIYLLFFTEVVPETSWLTTFMTDGNDMIIYFE